MRDCTRCGGFGELVTKTNDGRLGGYVTCADCDGYGLLPSDGQSRKKSLVETITSTVLGFCVSLVLISLVLPWFGYHSTATHNFWITVIFTLASVVRGYFVRRLFESLK